MESEGVGGQQESTSLESQSPNLIKADCHGRPRRMPAVVRRLLHSSLESSGRSVVQMPIIWHSGVLDDQAPVLQALIIQR